MCGIAGILLRDGNPEVAGIAKSMGGSLKHRGPDDFGVWANGPIALSHRRLAIVDLSSAGHQPMVSSDGKWTIVFNGEIYNVGELRRELHERGIQLRGFSDTEALLEMISIFGVKTAIGRCDGMFAIAAWNKLESELYLIRDRMGEKPLYYSVFHRGLAFASEIKALRQIDFIGADISRPALQLYLKYGCVPGEHSIWSGIKKLLPGHLLCCKLSRDKIDVAAECYWDIGEVAKHGCSSISKASDHDAINRLEVLLTNAVKGQMTSDVPLGAFLSGGVDSSLVVSVMQRLSAKAVNTFSIGFDTPGFDESNHASAVGKLLGTKHTSFHVSGGTALRTVGRLPEVWDEPFGDSSQLPTLLLSELTRKEVKVSLSGDGGDELFGGYTRYTALPKIWRWAQFAPAIMRLVAAAATARASQRFLSSTTALTNIPQITERLYKLAKLIPAQNEDELYELVVSHNMYVEQVLNHPCSVNVNQSRHRLNAPFSARMQILDQTLYLPDVILVKVDRAAMSVALETRVPFLDQKLIEFAWTLPENQKYRDGKSKWLLRQLLYRYLPKKVIERPKMGFTVPLDSWLRGELKGWAKDMLDEGQLRKDGYFRVKAVQKLWHDFLSGHPGKQHQLWDILMFQAWLRRWT